MDLPPEIEDMKLALYTQYLEAEQQETFEGSFQDFLHLIEREDLVEVRLERDGFLSRTVLSVHLLLPLS